MRVIDVKLNDAEVRRLRHAAAICAGEHAACQAQASVLGLDGEQLLALMLQAGMAIESCELLRWLAGDREDRP